MKWESELVEQADIVKAAVEESRKKIFKYDLSLGADTERVRASRIVREIQFAVSDEANELRLAVSHSQEV